MHVPSSVSGRKVVTRRSEPFRRDLFLDITTTMDSLSVPENTLARLAMSSSTILHEPISEDAIKAGGFDILAAYRRILADEEVHI